MIGETISHYRITDKLGAGGMGIVYKAQDLQLERFVALKFLPPDLSLSEMDRERFLREARSASALDHPNIGVIHGIDKTADGQMFIVMAYYEGQTLSQKLGSGMLTLRQAMDWACQIASGLAAAHARNIVHRDIKPSNIIITKDNTARIVDFGLARVVANPSATMSAGVTGTLPYMSPEQILGEAVNQSCDVWALAILLVQLVTGSHPFARESTTAMTFAILNQPPAAIEALPALLQPIALHGLAKQVAHRYPDAKDMLTDLESARAQFSSSGVPLDEPTLTRAVPSAALKDVISHASTPRWQTGTAEQTAAQAAAATATAEANVRRRSAPYFFVGLTVLVLAAGSLLIPTVREHAAEVLSGSGGEKHVAVLPFENVGNDPANEAVAEGLMDSLTSKLSNLDATQKALWVVPASVVRSRKVADPSAAQKDLGANLVVQGSIRRDGKKVQLTVNLIDAKNLRQMNSAVLDDATGDLSALQDEAVARLAQMMKFSNVTAESLRATGGRASPAAYELYLKALGLMERYDKAGNLDQAVTALQEAVKTDAQFALGYASLGEAFRLKNQVDPNPRWIEQASAMLQRAVQLDNRLPSAYVTLGRLHDASGKYDLAEQEFQRALQLDSRNADALDGLALAQEKAGQKDEAEATLKRAIALRPDYWDTYNTLALFYDRQNRFDEGIAQLQKAIALTPDNAQLYLNLGALYADTGKANDLVPAASALTKSIELRPSYAALANLGFVYAQEGRYLDAALTTEKALKLNDQNYAVWRNLAEDYAWAEQPTKAAEAQAEEMRLLTRQAELNPQDAEMLSELASVYAHQNLKEKAVVNMHKALALAPENSTVLINASETSESLGQRAEAIRYAEQGLKKGFSLEDLKKRYALRPLLADPAFKAPAGK